MAIHMENGDVPCDSGPPLRSNVVFLQCMVSLTSYVIQYSNLPQVRDVLEDLCDECKKVVLFLTGCLDVDEKERYVMST